MATLVERLEVGGISENAYVLASDSTCILVDPGDEADRILGFLESRGLFPACIIATHGHLDHTGAIAEVQAGLAKRRSIHVPLAVHPADRDYFGAAGEKTNRALFAAIHASGYFHHFWRGIPEPDFLLADGGLIPGTPWRVIHTPGHSRGSICLHDAASGILISGDTLFRDGVGRTDAPDADAEVLALSLDRLFALPPRTIVYPGHGEATTIGRESSFHPNRPFTAPR